LERENQGEKQEMVIALAMREKGEETEERPVAARLIGRRQASSSVTCGVAAPAPVAAVSNWALILEQRGRQNRAVWRKKQSSRMEEEPNRRRLYQVWRGSNVRTCRSSSSYLSCQEYFLVKIRN
uniref:Uncharacterized protein n=1 Tax=Aegilops tauschii subsp. strangulata TaxID=200361 RepID=A0A453ERJ2_AEGTS